MVTTDDNLDSLSDGDLNILFATEVAGLVRTRDGGWKSPRGAQTISYCSHDMLDDYCNEPNEVIDWLSMHHNFCRNNAGGGWQIDLLDAHDGIYASSHAQFISFARAAVIALLRAGRAGRAVGTPGVAKAEAK